MQNRNVGYLLLGVSILITMIILIFNSALQEFVSTCPLIQEGTFCPAHSTVMQQTYISLSIVGLIGIIALFLIISKPEKELIIKRIKDRKLAKKIDTSELKPEERQVLGLVQNNKAVFQADLIEKTGFGKAKMTRIIDRLEGQGFVERKRRGMTNIVVLKEN